MASVTPRKARNGDIMWRVQFRIDGKMCQESFLSEKGAREFGRLVDNVGGVAARAVLEARQSKDVGMPTLREYTEKYLDPNSGLLTGIEPGTRAGYARNAERSFLQVLGDYPLDAITKPDVGKWVAWQEAQASKIHKGKTISAKTMRNYHATLSAIFKSAIDEGIINTNPAYRTRLSKGIKHEGVFLSRDEFATLLHFTEDRYKRFLLFLAGTGCRWGEATAITWGDINFDAHPATVRIDKAWKKAASGAPVLKHPKSSKATRTISLWPELVEALGEPGPSDGLLFPSPETGTHLWPGGFRSRVWLPAVEKAMDPVACAAIGAKPLTRRPTVHDLRHTHASWLVASGAPLPFVQARMGHESITTTIGVYGHLLPDAHIQMASMMSETMSGVLPTKEITA
jgi:integrase